MISNRIDGVMVSLLASSAVDRGFEPQTRDYEIGNCCFSAKDKEQKLVGSESEKCVQVGRHVYLRTVVSVS